MENPKTNVESTSELLLQLYAGEASSVALKRASELLRLGNLAEAALFTRMAADLAEREKRLNLTRLKSLAYVDVVR